MARSNDRKQEVTLYEEGIPEAMNPKGLFDLFSKYGVVYDVFIPKKRNKAGKRFGFVRYRCSVSAEMAILKYNGLWIGEGRVRKLMEHGGMIRVQKVANGWLHKSAVATLHKYNDLKDCLGLIELKGTPGILVSPCGGKQVIMTFPTTELRDKMLAEEKEDLGAWFKEFHALEPSLKIGRDREVWIICFGVPLELWSTSTFCEIASKWGEVLAIEISTAISLSFYCGKVGILTECMEHINCTITISSDGKLFPIRIIEERVVLVNKIVGNENSWTPSSNELSSDPTHMRSSRKVTSSQNNQNPKFSKNRKGTNKVKGSTLSIQRLSELGKSLINVYGGDSEGLKEGEESQASKEDANMAAWEIGVVGERTRGCTRFTASNSSSNPEILLKKGEDDCVANAVIDEREKKKESLTRRAAIDNMGSLDGGSTNSSKGVGFHGEKEGYAHSLSIVSDSADEVARKKVLFEGHMQQDSVEKGDTGNRDDLPTHMGACIDLNLSIKEVESFGPRSSPDQLNRLGQNLSCNSQAHNPVQDTQPVLRNVCV
ncbi:hypothetical protein Dimus_026650 [Dionaea muscipula]